ncbi:hypothetical protein IQ06DRAFT_310498 [Phaeosphaeriaceae sp. SRC1lsM3a]|nr:hypothetical protein IQ06DRAFT_310498 [Stagonospora sp. SRC1lsM3a]
MAIPDDGTSADVGMGIAAIVAVEVMPMSIMTCRIRGVGCYKEKPEAISICEINYQEVGLPCGMHVKMAYGGTHARTNKRPGKLFPEAPLSYAENCSNLLDNVSSISLPSR